MNFEDQRASSPSGWDGLDRRSLPQTEQKGGVKFDATINLGHMLTFAGFILAGFTAWSTLDKRVTVIEERAGFQAQIDRNQDAVLQASMAAIKESLTEIKARLTQMNDRMDRNNNGRNAP